MAPDLTVITSDKNGVRTIRLNNPRKLNAFDPPMMAKLSEELTKAASDPTVIAAIITGTGRYYCAGVDFGGAIKPMHPRTLHEFIRASNYDLFDDFISFPKPLVVALNGPAVGAAATSCRLADYVIAVELASINTPFKKLALVPEGCSSYTFPKILGDELAKKVLRGYILSSKEGAETGFMDMIVSDDALMEKAQEVAEELGASGRKKWVESGELETLKKTNAQESIALADAIMSYGFMNHQMRTAWSKGNYAPTAIFALLNLTRPIWSRL